MIPGSTVTMRFSSSKSNILFILVKSRTIPPCIGMAPPKPQLAPPLGTIGIPSSAAILIISEISLELLGFTTKSGIILKPNSIILGNEARSWLYIRLSKGSLLTLSLPVMLIILLYSSSEILLISQSPCPIPFIF